MGRCQGQRLTSQRLSQADALQPDQGSEASADGDVRASRP